MMSSSKILIAVCGLSSVVGGGFFLLNKTNKQEKNNLNNEKIKAVIEKEKYLLGKIVNKQTNIPTEGLINGENQNYFCKVDETIISTCKIYKLNINNDADASLNLTEIQNNENVTIFYLNDEQEKILEGKNISIYQKNTKNLIFNISIDNLNEQKQNIFPAKKIIAKIKKINPLVKENGESKFKCQIDEKEVNCNIYKLPTNNNLNSKIKNPFFKYVSINQQVEIKEDISVGEYVVIETEDKTLKTSNWKSNTTTLYVNNNSENKEDDKFAEIEFIAPLYFEKIFLANEQMDYLIASPESITNSPSPNPTLSKDNYKCMIPISENTSISDDSCVVYKISEASDSNIKTIDFAETLKNTVSKKVTSNLTASEIYLLGIKRKKLSKLYANKKITLVNKDDKTKKYFDLNKKHKLNSELGVLKTNILLVKVKSTESGSNFGNQNNYKCKFTSNQQNKQDCKVYNFSSDQTISETSEIKTNELQKLIESNKTNANKDKFLIIEINGENNMFTEKELRSFIPEIYSLSSSSKPETPLLKTEYVHSYIGNISLDPSNSSDLLRIKKSSEDFFLVSYSSKNSPQANDELTGTNNIKNYMCNFTHEGVTFVDDTCELKIINESGNNPIQYSSITTPSTSAIKKTNFADNKLFKLIVNNPNFFYKINTDAAITIASNKNTESNNYGEVKVIMKSFDSKKTGYTGLYLVKAKSGTSLSNKALTNLNCKLQYAGNLSACSVYKFATEPNPDQVSNLSFSNASTTISNATDITAEKYYVVKYTEGNQMAWNIDYSHQTLELKNEHERITSFDLVSPIYAKNNTHTSGSIVFLK